MSQSDVMPLSAASIRSNACTPEVFEGDKLCDLTRIFEPQTQMVIAPFDDESWSPEAMWGRMAREGRLAVMTLDGKPNREDLDDAFRVCSALGRLLSNLSEVFATLVGAQEVGIRWMWTCRPSCPRFHEDKVAIRAIYNHCGPGTEWVPSQYVDREYLGHKSGGLDDEVSGLLLDSSQIREVASGTLSVFKGKVWEDNPGLPIVHRSPPRSGTFRFVATLDLLD
ncbi:MAG: DUF1826 domain-containing protein [Myxococcales bacterium]|nr:DUF1826 domain-containing protein [Myxococcales bacterium]